MSNKPQMVPGFNHNIKHRGHIFHIQTEDSGAANPHIITHLFVGGNILATKKTSYADIAQADNLHEIVRELMQEQHKAMLRNLINGVYDGVANGSGVALEKEAPTPASKPDQVGEPTPSQARAAVGRSPSDRQTEAQAAVVAKPGLPQPPVTLTPKSQPAAAQALEPGKFPTPAKPPATRRQMPAASQPPPVQPAASQPPPVRPAQPPPIPAAQSQPPPAAQKPAATVPTATAAPVGFSRPITGTQIHRPPAPERVPAASKPTTKVTLRPVAEQAAIRPAAAAEAARASQAAAVEAADQKLPPEVLAARRLAEKPKPKDTSGPTIFGENLISEKSLDEVILGYLAGNEEGGA